MYLRNDGTELANHSCLRRVDTMCSYIMSQSAVQVYSSFCNRVGGKDHCSFLPSFSNSENESKQNPKFPKCWLSTCINAMTLTVH